MNIRRRALVLLIAAEMAIAGERKPLEPAEMKNAYNLSVDWIYDRLKAPSTATFATSDQSEFSRGMKDSVDVRLWVDAQNSFSAMLRTHFQCRVSPRKDKRYRVFCFSL